MVEEQRFQEPEVIMSLEKIIEMYGMNDYYDHNTGYIYCLSEAIDEGDTYRVPVKDNGILIGYSSADK